MEGWSILIIKKKTASAATTEQMRWRSRSWIRRKVEGKGNEGGKAQKKVGEG